MNVSKGVCDVSCHLVCLSLYVQYPAGRPSKFKTFLTPVWLMGGVRLIQTQCEVLTLGSVIVPRLVRKPPGTHSAVRLVPRY